MSDQELISSSLEDYLEAIAEIIEHNGHAHTKDIADRLRVKMPSVTNALQALSVRGLIEYRSHAPVVLTSLGAKKAAVIRHRHTVLKRFFGEILKLEAGDADSAACRIEHVIGETVLSRFVVLTEAVGDRADCAGLRAYLDEIMPKIATGDDSRDWILLDQLPKGRVAVVMKVGEKLRGVKKFADLGLVVGSLLEFEGSAPLGDLMRVKVMGSSLSLRASDARHILVKVME